MKSNWIVSVALAAAFSMTGCPGVPPVEPPEDAPRLILVLVVDQLGADHLERFDEAFEGGFRTLLDRGVSFREAHHAHADTSTAPGHATIATGRHPSRHGIISNYWVDPETGEDVYAVGDERHERAPTRLVSSALGDWLQDRYSQSKVFALSAKDRSAILLGGGRAHGAYWYGWDGAFTSSTYYPEATPLWLAERNAVGFFASKYGEVWTPLPFDAEALARMGVTEHDLGPLEEDFPHPIGGLSPAPDENFYGQVFESPWMDEYILQLARAVVDAESLGQDRFPDLLALGFSTSDSVGHAHGPESREFFDILLRLDQELGSFFDWLDQTVGMDHVTVALSSDHGSVPVPEFQIERGLPGRRAGVAEIACLQSIDAALDREFGPARWFRPGPYFEPVAPETGVSTDRLHDRVRALIEDCPSVARVWMAEDLASEAPSGGEMQQRFAHSFFPGRSPDFEIQWDEYFLPSTGNASSHGTPYRYDTHVPLVFLRPGRTPGRLEVPVRTVDVAPTLAAWAGVEPPGDLDGRSLDSLMSTDAGPPR